MKQQYRSIYIDKLAERTSKRTTFPELNNLNQLNIDIHGFNGEKDKKEWEKIEKMIEGSKL